MNLRSTKIIATLGPASLIPGVLERLIAAGMDVARLNFSHIDISDGGESVKATVARIRKASKEAGRPITVLADLPGPKMRVVNLGGAIAVSPGDRAVLVETTTAETTDSNSEEMLLQVRSDKLTVGAHEGDRVLMADGMVAATVTGVKDDRLHVQITDGGVLSEGKGIHLPDGYPGGGAITLHDEECIRVALEADVDWLAVSFVSQAADVEKVRHLIGGKANIIAKIERMVAVNNIEGILASADGIMVARGDLGVELAPELLPAVQKEIVALANDEGKPVVVATEMLESMVNNSRATRAEVSDVANAVLDGSSAVMLSAETAIGKNPLDSVRTMDRILQRTEGNELFTRTLERHRRGRVGLTHDGSWAANLAVAASQVAEVTGAKAVVTVTETGNSALKLAAARPGCPVVACCHDDDVAARLGLLWGVEALTLPRYDTRTELRRAATDAAARLLGIKEGVMVVLLGKPGRSGGVDTLRLVDLTDTTTMILDLEEESE